MFVTMFLRVRACVPSKIPQSTVALLRADGNAGSGRSTPSSFSMSLAPLPGCESLFTFFVPGVSLRSTPG
jgi:hypothetical protein